MAFLRPALLLAAVQCLGAEYSGPFTLLSSSALSGTSTLSSHEGPEDHLVECGGALVLLVINTDPFGGSDYTFTSTDGGSTWLYSAPTLAAPCPDNTTLSSRDAGYSVGMARDPATGLQRMMVLGGDDTERNVFFSDDCGATFYCSSARELQWTPRRYTWVGAAPWNATGAHTLLMGGLAEGSEPSASVYESFDLGMTWERPSCTDPDPAPAPTQGGCNLGGTFQLPSPPAYPGSLVPTPDGSLYFFLDPEQVFVLTGQRPAHGFQRLPAANASGALGRKAWVGSPSGSAGCLFSTDWDAGALWVAGSAHPRPTSSSLFATAPSALGPWGAALPAPWAARVAPAVLSTAGGTRVVVAGGFCMQDGALLPCTPGGAPARDDVWAVDAGVCLLSRGGSNSSNSTAPALRPCNGKAAPDLLTVTCPCPAQWGGDALCASCGAGFAGAQCEACSLGRAGPACAPCAPCSAAHGSCRGSGTQAGDGACVCASGWRGADCSQPAQGSATATATAAPAATATAGASSAGSSTPKPPPMSAGAAVGVALVAVLGAAAVGVGVFAAYFGGGPVLAQWAGAARAGSSKAVAALSGTGSAWHHSERTSLLAAGTAAAAPKARAAAGGFVAVAETGGALDNAFSGPAFTSL